MTAVLSRSRERAQPRPAGPCPLPEDIELAIHSLQRVYENAYALAEEGVVEFDVLDLRPALAILYRHLGAGEP